MPLSQGWYKMPYDIVKRSGEKPWKIIKRETGEQVGESETRELAESSVKARLAGDHGWKPTGKPREG